MLVTGREGQVARAARECGPALGIEVITLGRPELDLTNPESVRMALLRTRPDAVLSAAAYTDVERAEDEPEMAYAVNAEGAGAVGAFARELGVPVVHLSTDYVFDGSKPTAYAESDPTAPINAYGRSKLAGEQAIALHQPDYLILRASWIFSPFGTNFVRTMLRLARGQPEVRVVDDQWGRPTSAAMVAETALKLCSTLREQPGAGDLRGLFHLAPLGSASWADFAEAVFAGSRARGGPTARVVRVCSGEFPARAERPRNSRLDGRKLAEVHGHSAPSWTDSLEACLERLLAR